MNYSALLSWPFSIHRRYTTEDCKCKEERDVLQYLIKGCESLNPTQPAARADLSHTGANISDFRFQLSYLGQALGPLDLSLTGIEEETCIDFLKLRGVLL